MGGAFMNKQHKAVYLMNAFLLGVITGFFLTLLKNGIQVYVSNKK